jgi:hypothetical protein
MDNFKEQLVNTFNKLNDKSDSSISEDGFLNINLNLFDTFNNKVPIVFDPNLTCEHIIKIEINIPMVESAMLILIENELREHIQKELENKSNSKIIVCMFLYSAVLSQDKVKPYLTIKSNFKIKK